MYKILAGLSAFALALTTSSVSYLLDNDSNHLAKPVLEKVIPFTQTSTTIPPNPARCYMVNPSRLKRDYNGYVRFMNGAVYVCETCIAVGNKWACEGAVKDPTS